MRVKTAHCYLARAPTHVNTLRRLAHMARKSATKKIQFDVPVPLQVGYSLCVTVLAMGCSYGRTWLVNPTEAEQPQRSWFG